MSQQLTRDQVSTVIGTAIGEVWNSSEKLVQPNYKKWLNEFTTPHAKLISYQVAYPSTVAEKPDGEAIQYDSIKFGTVLTIDPVTYAIGVRMTYEALEDMGKNPFGDFSSAQLVAATRVGKAFRDAMSQKQDLLATQVIVNGNSATASSGWQGTGWDGKALFATDHPILSNTSILGGTTYSNLGAAATLSQSTLFTLISSLETQPTLEGFVRPFSKKYKLVVGPGLRGTAYTAVETAKINKLAGSFDNDVPALADFDIEVIVDPFLGASSTRYLLISDDAKIGYWERQAPQLDDEKDFETKGHKWSALMRHVVAFQDSYGAMLSVGA